MGEMRLDRYVSRATGLSRSQVKSLIRKGRVTVDGRPVRSAGAAVTSTSVVAHAGRQLALPDVAYLMMHKPTGLLSATSDRRQATVMSLLPPDLAGRVHLVGRLDKDTSGLLLLTEDGTWSHRISSPRHHCAKTYRVMLAEPLQATAAKRLSEGLMLRGESRPTAPARLECVAPDQYLVTITEGRYHQVRRMFAAVDNRVLQLHRERIGGLALDPALAPGQWRMLTPSEREAVLSDEDSRHTVAGSV